MAEHKLPWVIVSEDATETARYLIQHAGGVQAAHDAVTRAAKKQKQKHGRPASADTFWLLIADSIQRRDGCSDNAALNRIADLVDANGDKISKVRRLRRKLGGKTLAEVACLLPLYGEVGLSVDPSLEAAITAAIAVWREKLGQ